MCYTLLILFMSDKNINNANTKYRLGIRAMLYTASVYLSEPYIMRFLAIHINSPLFTHHNRFDDLLQTIQWRPVQTSDRIVPFAPVLRDVHWFPSGQMLVLQVLGAPGSLFGRHTKETFTLAHHTTGDADWFDASGRAFYAGVHDLGGDWIAI